MPRSYSAAPWPVFAERLRAVGYSAEALTHLLGIRVPDDVGALNHAAAVERLRADPSPLAAFIRLFFLETGEHAAGRIGAPELREWLIRRGILTQRRGRLHARLRLDAVGPHWLFSDRRFAGPDARAGRLPAGDPVYPPSADSLLLRDIVMPRGRGTVLDVCTGSGVQALAVAEQARDVTAVDISPRAVGMAALNAELNGCSNVTIHVGDLYRPVRGRRFDTVIANPPFVPSPYRRGPAYHSGGPTGTRVLQRIVTGLPRVLAPRGRFFAVSHVALRRGESVTSVVRPWFREFSGRTLALVVERGSAIDLAAAQALFALEDGLPAYAAEVRRWVTYLRRHGITEVVALLLAAEQGGRRTFVETEALQRSLPLPLSHPPRHHVEQWLA